MKRIFNSATWLFLACLFAFVLHSCLLEGRYEERLSLTTEEFEATVMGKWKCVRAGNGVFMDNNEEDHIPEHREIAIELDYVDISSDSAVFYFKTPVPFFIYDPENPTTGSISQLTYTRSENSLFGNYTFEYNNETECYCLNYDPTITSGFYTGNINAYGKEDKHADRLIIGLSWDVYFECERK